MLRLYTTRIPVENYCYIRWRIVVKYNFFIHTKYDNFVSSQFQLMYTLKTMILKVVENKFVI